jgi:hypothetical protein
MEINLDLNSFSDSLISALMNITSSPDVFLMNMFVYLGWIPVSITFLWGAHLLWINYRQTLWAEKNAKFTFLAIDIPRGNAQSPRAVENLFNYLGGAHGSTNLMDTYWDGKFQLAFSFEIVSNGGYTQFLVRTPIANRDMVESAIYSQYPDAEITEVEDYAKQYSDVSFPSDKYDIAGAEFLLTGDQSMPIRTYTDFEHQLGEPETTFRDPMAALMDLCSSLKPGEQLWYQILVIPTDMAWPSFVEEKVSDILKEKKKAKPTVFNDMADQAMSFINVGATMIVGGEAAAPKKEEKKDDSLKMMNLKPKQKKQVEGIYEKASKMPFKVKIRAVYLAEKEVANKAKGFSGFVGFMKQFTATDLNGIKPDMDKTGTSTAYLFKDSHLNQKKNKILKNYINRSVSNGRTPFYLNVEELATIWHFPIEGVVKAPLIQKTSGRKAEPPMTLPQAERMSGEEKVEPLFLGDIDEEDENDPLFLADEKAPIKKDGDSDAVKIANVTTTDKKASGDEDIFADEKGAPPSNLPFI